MVLSPFLLAGVSVSSAIGYYYFIKQRKLTKLFESLEKIEQYDFDYVPDPSEIPLNKTIVFYAEIDSDALALKQSKYNPKRKVIFSQIKKILPRDKKLTKQVLSDENESFDEYYNTITNHNLPKITLINKMQNEIKIEWPKIDEIGLFYIKPIMEKIDPAKIPDVPNESSLDRALALIPGRKKLEYGEIGLVPDEKYMYIGELRNPATQRLSGKADPQFIFQPRYILGESKDFFLKYIDGQIIKAYKRTKLAFSVTVGLGLFHIASKVYSHYSSEITDKKKSKKDTPDGK